MSNTFFNPLLHHKQDIVPLSTDFPKYLYSLLEERGIKINTSLIELGKKKSWIEWDHYPDHYSFIYDFEENEEIIREYFRKSQLAKCKYIIMEFGYQAAISKIPVDIFIKYWYELVIIAGYESVVIVDDSSFFMEFVRRDYVLKSNFAIAPE
jgi:hypothetical protein